MDIESLNTFDILAMLDVPVSPADQVRGYIDILMMVCNTNPAWIQDNRHWVAIDFIKEGGISLIHLDTTPPPPSYFGFEEFMNENCATWFTMPLSCNHQSPMMWISRDCILLVENK